jgi:C_GCAxxG_C_C family probable redox protein
MKDLILDSNNHIAPQADALIAQIRDRARNLYETRQLLCTEAVVVALNRGLGGGLTDQQAIAMAAPFCVALGESGCICGALSGAVMASGLFVGNDRPYRNRQNIREGARQLHDSFKTANGATCCRVLTQKVRHDKDAHFQQCADLTAQAAELAARMILQKRPELLAGADKDFSIQRQSKIRGALLRLINRFTR